VAGNEIAGLWRAPLKDANLGIFSSSKLHFTAQQLFRHLSQRQPVGSSSASLAEPPAPAKFHPSTLHGGGISGGRHPAPHVPQAADVGQSDPGETCQAPRPTLSNRHFPIFNLMFQWSTGHIQRPTVAREVSRFPPLCGLFISM
jgi:hypothetical protein